MPELQWSKTPLPGRASLLAAAVLPGALYAGSTLVTPLYPLYQHRFGLTIMLVYATYVIGNLGALCAFGHASDQAGRRHISLLMLAVGGASALLFLLAVHPAMLFLARAASGLAIGVGAATAAADRRPVYLYAGADKASASRLAAAVNLAGLAGGVLLAGLLAQFAPWPLRTVFLVYLLILVTTAAFTARTRETVDASIRANAQLSFKPRIGVPSGSRAAFVAPAVTAFATFALLGFYAALLPNLLANSMNIHSPATSGAIVAELFAAGAVTVALTPLLPSRVTMFTGLVLLPPSLGLLLWAQAAGSIVLLILASALCGIASAFGFRGSLQEVNRIAPPQQRAELLSAYLLCCYSGNSLPAVGVALLSRHVGHLRANVAFAAVCVTLALIALAIGIRQARREDRQKR